MADEVLVEDRGRVRVITLNRPEAKNAVNNALGEALFEAIEGLDADGGLTAGVLTPDNVHHQGALYTMLFGGGAMTVFGLLCVSRRQIRFASQRRAGQEEI